MLGLVIAFCVAFAAPQVMGQRMGDQVWVDLEAERIEEDGFAEGLAISMRPGLVEVQPSRVQMAHPSDLANLLRRGNAFVPAAQVSPLEAGRRNWEAKQAVLAFRRRSDQQAFFPAGPDLQALLRTASEPRNRERMREARELLFFLNAMAEPRGSEAALAGDLLQFVNEGWTSFADMRMINSEAFDRAAPALARRAAEAIRQLGGLAAFDPNGQLSDFLRTSDWASQHGSRRPASPAQKRVLHLIQRTYSARFDVVSMAAPARVVEAIRTLPTLMASLETLHPDAIIMPNAPAGRDGIRQAFLQRMRDDIADTYKERINDEEEVRRLRDRYLEGEDAALGLWMRKVTEMTSQVASALGNPLFTEQDRNTLVEARRALMEQRAREQANQAAARARLEEQQRAAEQRRAAIAALGSQIRNDWQGNVTCGSAVVPLRFEIAQPNADGRITASFSYLVPNGLSIGTMQGVLDPTTRKIRLEFVQWIRSVALEVAPGPVELTLNENGQVMSGIWVTSNCRPFQLQRAEALTQWLSRNLPAIWRGSVKCGDTEFAQALEFKSPVSAQAVNATLTYGPEARRGIIELRGVIDIGGRITLEPTRWVRRPQDDRIDGIELDPSTEGPSLNGRLLPRTDVCQAFVMRRG
jgi:hypothetical protein